MKAIIKYFIENPIVGNLLMIFLLIIGYMGMRSMNTTLVPEMDSRLITIRCIYPGSSPQEVEEGVVTKIEEGLKGISGIEQTTSICSENVGLITIEVLKGFDVDLVLREVKNAIDQIATFPAGMEPPIITRQEYLGFVLNFAVSGNADLKELKQYARQIERDLLRIDGISKVEITGYPEEEIEIGFREADLRRYDLTFDEAVLAVRNANLEVTGGKVRSDKSELAIRARNRSTVAYELGNIVLRNDPEGGNVLLYQVANIIDQWEDAPDRSFLNGNPAAIVTVSNTLQEDMLTVNRLTKDFLEEFNRRHADVQAVIIDDGSIPLRQRMKLMTDNGIIGFGLVVVILALFLNWRLAFWVALAIPVSFAGTFIFAGPLAVTINMMSLFGMIIVVGILVDDGIVIAENIYQKYEAGLPPAQAALQGTMEVLPAVFAAIITTVVAFCGFFFVDGRMGEYGHELAIVVIFSLLFSLVEGALILPAHVAHSRALRDRDARPNPVQSWFDGIMTFLRDRLYRPVLRFASDYSLPTVAIAIAGMLVLAGAFEGGVIRSTFFPSLPSETFTVDLKLPAGTAAQVTDNTLDRIERVAAELNESYSRQYFNGEKDLFLKMVKRIGPGANEGSLTVSMLSVEERGALTERDVIAMLREQVGPVYEAESIQYRFRSPFGKPVVLSILGSDYEKLDRAAAEIEDRLRKMADLRDIVSNNSDGAQEIQLSLKPGAANLGFTLMDVMRQVRQGFFGSEVQNLQRGADEVKVWARYQAPDRAQEAQLARMRVHSPQGVSVELQQVAEISLAHGVDNIYHLDGQREVKIEAEVASNEVSVSEVLAEIRGQIVPGVLDQYPGLDVYYGGESREEEKTRSSLVQTLSMVFLIMFFIVVLTFQSVSQALIVYAIIPFGYIGIGFGHYVMGVSHSTVSILGAGALLGVLVNDALVFITSFNDRIRRGQNFSDALYETGMSRFRPIVLTSVTTIAGLAPILLEKSRGAQLLIPMAISVAFGLLIVTVIILALVPALLVLSNRIKGWAISMWEGEAVPDVLVEPAHPERKQLPLITGFGAIVSLAGICILTYAALVLAGWFF